jgi:hypothetical protein
LRKDRRKKKIMTEKEREMDKVNEGKGEKTIG